MAAQAAQRGARNFVAAAAKFKSLADAFAAQAAQVRQQASPVADGWMVPGGLIPAASGAIRGSSAFQGATRPDIAPGTTNITIVQTSPKAVVDWQSFNIGRHTNVYFNQTAGGIAAPTWSVLNRIEDPTQSPTQIFGAIHAEGQVWVLNANGVLFGAGSQVSLHSLVAGAFTTTDTQFLNAGLYAPNHAASFVAGPGSVLVQPGASIVTPPPASALDGGGSVILMGASVENAGLISTPDGQTILGAGQSFMLRQGYSATPTAGSTSAGDTTSTVLGSEIEVSQGGTVTNANQGLIQATTGDITLVGQSVTQAGVLNTTSSVSRRGTIHLLTSTTDANASVTFAPGSVTSITPDQAGGTALASSQQSAYTAQTAYSSASVGLLNNQAQLADQPGYSRIEVTTGGYVDFGGQSLVLAPGGQVAVSAGKRVFAETAAQVDVSGLTGIVLPLTASVFSVNVQGSQLADAPVNRDSGVLTSSTVQLDLRTLTEVPASAADAQNRYYTAGGLLNVTGQLGQINSTIGQWLTVGGRITLSSNEVVTQPGSVFNIAGGAVTYQAGNVPQSYAIGPGGNLYDINNAPAGLPYSGIYGGFVVDQPRWGIHDVYNNPLYTPASIYEPGYTQGRDGGSLLLSTPTAVFEGAIEAGAAAGTQQIHSRPAAAPDPFLLTQQIVPLAGGLTLENAGAAQPGTFPTDVTIGAGSGTIASTLTPTATLGARFRDTAGFDAATLDGLGALNIVVGQPPDAGPNMGSIRVTAPLTLATGGTLSLSAPVIGIDAHVTARSGSITLQTEDPLLSPTPAFSLAYRGTIAVAPGVTIDTRGTFTNGTEDAAAAPSQAAINGGGVTLRSTGGLDLGLGSLIDASAGAVLTQAGGLTGGKGGDITLVGDDPAFDYASSPAADQRGYMPVRLDGTVRSLGVTSGGTFTLYAPAIVIGDAASNRSQVALASAFFGSGFGGYALNGFGPGSGAPGRPGVKVLQGTEIVVTEPLLQIGPNTLVSPTGTDPAIALQTLLLPTYLINPASSTVSQRPGASLALSSTTGASSTQVLGNGTVTSLLPGGIDIAPNASITVDAGQSVSLSSPAEIIVDGRITAPSGTISVLNTSQNAPFTTLPASQRAALSIWLGNTATLDVAARAVQGTALSGRPFGLAPQGGTIVIGAPTNPSAFENNLPSTDAFIFVRPGATLTAGGTSAILSTGAQAYQSLPSALSGPSSSLATSIASNGGTITFSSYSGIYLDGLVEAAAGGPTASGGTLGVEMDVPSQSSLPGGTPKHPIVPQWYYDPRRIVVSTNRLPELLPVGLKPGDGSFVRQPGVAGRADVSQALVTAGGFDNLFLLARDQIVFDPANQHGVTLNLGQSAILSAYAFSDATRSGSVSITAPYVALSGAAATNNDAAAPFFPGLNLNKANGTPSQLYQPCLSGAGDCASGTFQVTTDQLDLSRNVRFGVSGTFVDATGGTIAVDSPGFNLVDLASTGDIRFVPPASGTSDVTTSVSNANSLVLANVSLLTSGDLALSAARLYPATGTSAEIEAGLASGAAPRHQDPSTAYYSNSTLSFGSLNTAPQPTPFSAFGTLQIFGETILQHGVLDAPLGSIKFGAGFGSGVVPGRPSPAARIEFGPGSVTSVSADGATIPFGGTTDGLTYSYDAQPLTFGSAVYGASPGTGGQSVIAVDAINVSAAIGSTLDLRGGGTLTGGGGEILVSAGGTITTQSQGFIAGRGGSTDVLYSTLLTFNPAAGTYSQPSLAQHPVLAILPGLQSGYAPTTLLDATTATTSPVRYAGSLPSIGEQVTIGAGVPGLPAGTYTLLPSYYALLPGAYRVQLGAPTGASTPLGAQPGLNGSIFAEGRIGIANSLAMSQPISLILTPGQTVRSYAQFDEQNYATTAIAKAAVVGNPRAYLPQDAGVIDLNFLLPTQGPKVAGFPLDFAGTALLAAAPGGYDGDVIVEPETAPVEIVGAGATPTKGYVSITAASLDAFQAPLLLINGSFKSSLGLVVLDTLANNESVIVRSGADLNAGAIWLFGSGSKGVTVEDGATLSTLGRSANLPDSRTGAVFSLGGPNSPSASAVVLASGTYNFLGSPLGNSSITLGGCAAAPACTGGVTLASDGLVGLFSAGPLGQLGPVTVAAPQLILDSSSINFAADAYAGAVPPGITLSQSGLTGLLANSPAVQSLDLIASQSINLFGSLQFGLGPSGAQAGSPLQLILDTPAIFGAGAAGDTATLAADSIIWTNSAGTPGTLYPAGPGNGAGTLTLEARQITIGYAPNSQPQNQTTIAREAVGFAQVNLIGTQEVTGNNHASLAVHETQSAYDTATLGPVYSGGLLAIDTPLLTTSPGAIVSYTAGVGVTLAGVAGQSATTLAGGLGGEIDITAPTITDATRIALPSGKLVLDATGDITLGAGSAIDLAGPLVTFFDVTRGSWGGTLLLDSTQGNIVQDAAASIDVSAQAAAAGSISATALAGTISLAGALVAGAPGLIASNFQGGSIDLRGDALAGGGGNLATPSTFQAFNTALDEGGFTQARSFELAGPGSLTLPAGGTVTARNVSIAVDHGALDIEGTINASGAAPGTISLAGAGGLTLGAASQLDAQGSVAQCASGPCSAFAGNDQQDKPVDALNAAAIELTVPASVSSVGTSFVPNTAGLVIASGATIDIASPDPTANAKVEINVPRTTARSGDARIGAATPVNIVGATPFSSLDVNAFWTYSPDNSPFLAGGIVTQAAFGTAANPGPIASDAQAFIANALSQGLVGGKLAGLSAYTQAFHLRPGVEIDGSADVNGGALTVQGDINLAGLRYGGVNPNTQVTATPGSGEPGVLWLRAPGSLDVLGSISDGFATPPKTPDDQGWVLKDGTIPAGQGIVLPVPVYLGSGTVFAKTVTLSYPVRLAANTLAAGATAPVALKLTAPNSKAFVANVAIGNYPAGATVPAGALHAGTVVPAGAVFAFKIDFAAVTWPAGASLSALSSSPTLASGKPLLLAQGDLIPAGTKLSLVDVRNKPLSLVDLRPGGAGRIWGVSPLLAPGDLSWSLRLVGGAELAGANSQAVADPVALAAGASFTDPAPGSVTFSDLHVPNAAAHAKTVDFSVVRTGTGSLDVIAGGNISEATPFGIYTAGTQSAGVAAVYDQSRIGRSGTILGASGNISLGNATYNTADAASYQANYPTDGGNLLVQAGNTLTGDVYELNPVSPATNIAGSTVPAFSNDVSNWLWWQGSPTIASSWWINFGTYVNLGVGSSGLPVPTLVGFTGFGALGGGNVGVSSGGNAGIIAAQTTATQTSALDIAVASSGRIDPATLASTLTGGGAIYATFGGALNPGANVAGTAYGQLNVIDNTFGLVTDIRGPAIIDASSIGQVLLTYDDISQTALYSGGSGVFLDPRAPDPYVSKTFDVGGGPVAVLGDAQLSLQTRGDLALSAAGNPTLGYQVQRPSDPSHFSLWQNNTAITLASAGGNVVPATPYGTSAGLSDTFSNNGSNTSNATFLLYPPNLNVSAEQGSIFLQTDLQTLSGIELAPAPSGELQFLAGKSIYTGGDQASVLGRGGAIVDISGASTAPGGIPTPFVPGSGKTAAGTGFFGLEPDVATGLLHVGDPVPARFYAATGDIVGLQTGSVTYSNAASPTFLGYIAAKAVQVKAGHDIISLGVSQQLSQLYTTPQTGIFLNNNPSDISAIEAGNDILFSSALVAGPGLLIEQAGHNAYEGDQGFLESIGAIGQALTPATRNSGAGITVLAGLNGGFDPTAFANLYLDPANLANPAAPLQNQPGKVERTYQDQLIAFLQQRFGYSGTAAGALAAFLALPPDQQTAFALTVYFAELNQSGLDYNTPSSRFYQSYIEGQEAIRTLFPNTDRTGTSPAGGGGLTTFSGNIFTSNNGLPVPNLIDGGIRTDFGGAITTVVPYGTTLLGNYGIVPGKLSGVVTQGTGNIDMYSYGSVILGQSRVLTTFGGNILIWLSSDGEINAGRGSSSTALIPPLSISYDQFGNILLSPTVPSSGAGIGTLAPIPDIPAGDLNLIAPFGTVDAGEAGIRVSGNANIAARVVVNGANISVGGKSAGIPTVAAANASAAAAASAAAGASTNAAQQTLSHSAPVQQPSVIEVEVLSISGGGDTDDEKRRKRAAQGL